MKFYSLVIILTIILTGCDSSAVDFDSVKVFNNQFQMTIDRKDKYFIDKFDSLFNDKVEHQGVAPNFKYLIEFETSNGNERWRYSDEGYTMKYSQEDQRIYALIDKAAFNALLTGG